MAVYDMSLEEVIENYYFDSCKLNNYLQLRIMKKLCTEEEIEKLEFIARELRNDLKNNKSRVKTLQKIQYLVLLSNDNINHTDNYLRFKEYEEKSINELSEDQLFDYIEIVLKDLTSCFSINKLELLIIKYLDKSSSNEELVELVNKYGLYYFSEEEKEKILISVNKNVRKIEEKILKELQKDVVSYDILINYFSSLISVSLEYFSFEDIFVFDSICDYFRNNNELRMKIDNIKDYMKLEKLALDFYDRLTTNNKECIKEEKSDDRIKRKIVSGEIQFNRMFPANVMVNVNTNFDDLEIECGKNIIAIDDPLSPDLDGAFSIEKFDDIYMFNVYVSDVPTFLMKNVKLCREAYKRGNSFYFRRNSGQGNINIDMLPQFLSHKFLSFNSGYPKNAIEFSYIFDKNGNVIFRNVDRKRIIVTHGISPQKALEIMNSEENLGKLQKDLLNYRELCKVVSSKSKDRWLRSLSFNNINDLVGFPSILTNYYIGHRADFAIYRNKGSYVKNSEERYTHSTTPLRRFVSDINLAFFLDQNGVVNFNDKYLNYVENNVDEIIGHLNECDEISKFIERNSKFAKKYVKSYYNSGSKR